MNRAIRILVSILATAGALASCSTSSGGGTAGDGGGGGSGGDAALGGDSSDARGDAGATLGVTIAPPTETGNSVVDRLGAAAATCGQQSMFTVPGGWQIVAVGDKGCTVWVPPGWTIQGAYTGLATAMKDASGEEGFLGVAGATDTTSCDPATVRDAVLDGYTKNGYAAPSVLWHHEQTDMFGGSAWPTGHTVFSTAARDVALVGYLWLLTTQTVIACDVVGLGFWEPVAAIEADTCTLTQIVNSVKCPSGGGSCSDAECDAQCKGGGSTGGTCSPEGNCNCY